NRIQLAQIYSVSDLVLVPSLVESFGQVAAEASACETPVVCFKTSGLMDIVIPNETGWVAKPFSIESFADQLEKASQTSSEVRKEMGKLARNHIERNFSIPVVQENYRRILLEILGNKKKPLVS
ncbi:MAG: glycosyltransferase, partial [Cyclobacteriaceae bacterium]|nr:glycosyltransferase [Cyclobacteriaceae bacterium]